MKENKNEFLKNIFAGVGAVAIIMWSLSIAMSPNNAQQALTLGGLGGFTGIAGSPAPIGSNPTSPSGGTLAGSPTDGSCGIAGKEWAGLPNPSDIDLAGYSDGRVYQGWAVNPSKGGTGGSVTFIDAPNNQLVGDYKQYLDKKTGKLVDFADPEGVVVADNLSGGTPIFVYVADAGLGKVFQFNNTPKDVPDPSNPNSTISVLEEVKEWTQPNFKPTKMIKMTTDIAVVNSADNTVLKLTPISANLTLFISANLKNIAGISVSGKYLFISEGAPVNKIHHFDVATGGNQKSYGLPGQGNGQFLNIQDIAYDPVTNKLYVADQKLAGVGEDKIHVFSILPDGTFYFERTYQMSQDGDEKTKNMTGMQIGPDGVLYVTTSDGFIRKFGVTNCVELDVVKVLSFQPQNKKSDSTFSFHREGSPSNPGIPDFFLNTQQPSAGLKYGGKDYGAVKTMSVPANSTQTITESNLIGGVFDLSKTTYRCFSDKYIIGKGQSNLGYQSQVGKGKSVTLTFAPDDKKILCTFYNYYDNEVPKNDAELTIIKDWDPGSKNQVFDFNLFSYSSIAENFQLDDNPQTPLPDTYPSTPGIGLPVPSGQNYLIQEKGLPGIGVGAACVYKKNGVQTRRDPISGFRKGNVANAKPLSGEKVTCTIRNCDIQSSKCVFIGSGPLTGDGGTGDGSQ